jgi:hypothetical protein
MGAERLEGQKGSKVFTIGFNKTGTSSIHHLFLEAGLKSQHKSGKWDLDDFQCFCDGSHHKGAFKDYDRKYPHSTFILNTRPLGNWLKSRSKHCCSRKKTWGWPPDRAQYAKWIRNRDEHFLDVMNHFAGRPDQLAVCNIERPSWEGFVLSLVGLEQTQGGKKHLRNRTPDEAISAETLSMISKEIEAALKEQGRDGGQLTPQSPHLNLFRSHL